LPFAIEGYAVKLILTQLRERSEDGRQNFNSVLQRIEQARLPLTANDILLLPELIGGRSSAVQYESWVQGLAGTLGCHVVGGTHHEPRGSGAVNCGVVADSGGAILTRYDKLRPYGIENDLGVRPGERPGQFELAGRRVLVLVCSDFWFSGLIGKLDWNPDLVLVSTFSISQRPNPEAARSLWQHMALSRA
jgi:predicted amidohydrolase